ncbi:MAG: ClC family H(+)/Cl(-) exchange transporter [Firmicutes bacterium]|nr:ClC family H(+)/Cl(-) exchange transporter [Bacillota bacterium]
MSKKTVRRRRKNFTQETLTKDERFKYKLIAEGLGVGVCAGLVVSLFRYALSKVEYARNLYIEIAEQKLIFAILGVFLLIFLALCIAAIIRKEPMSCGSGIPQVKGELKGEVNANWLQVVIAKFLGGIMALGAGLSLGREGPSIQLGAMVGKGFSRLNNRLRTEEKLLITCGSSAGLAAAFGAPVAGVVFALEELHRNFSQEVLLSTMAAAIAADSIGTYIFGLEPVFDLGTSVHAGLPLGRMWMVIILGVVMGAFGVFYNKTIEFAQDMFGKLKTPEQKLAIPFAVILLLAIVLPEALGSGHELIEDAGEGILSLKVLLMFLVVKYIFSAMSFGTGAPGGIFLPLLVLGALTGGLFTTFLSPIVGYEENYIQYFVILGMTGYFSAIVRAPITGVILLSEMTGTFSNLLPLSTVALVAYMTADVLGGEPIYDQLMDRMLAGGKVRKPKRTNKVLIEGEVYFGAFMEGKPLSEIDLPTGCLVVSIQRDNKEIVPGGDTVLEAGDKLTFLCNEVIAGDVQKEIDNKCKKISL